MKTPPRFTASILLTALATTGAWAQEIKLAELADLSLEQLTRITVTSVSRRAEPLAGAPASLYVITQEDIRRSGAVTLPGALRLAPNLHVARADNNQYVVSARGFSDILNNKLLVLIDGRTVYTPLFSGVFWEAQEVFLPDVARIEVISGPGATLWGANAVNGVINILTKGASDTQGAYVQAGVGDTERIAGLRHGFEIPGGHVRAYLNARDSDGVRARGLEIGDDSRLKSAGVRADWVDGEREITLQGNAYHGDVGGGPERDFSGASVRGRYTRALAADSRVSVQGYFDRTSRHHANTFDDALKTWDLELQHQWKPAAAHSLVWGGGLRHASDKVGNSASQAFLPAKRSLRWSNVFVQDDVDLTDNVSLTLGVKAERNPFTGIEWLPNARLSWRLSPEQFVWGALSRAVRAPSRLDRELFFPGVAPFQLTGSDAFESEVANVAEIGWRVQATTAASFSATLYHHDYPNLRSVGPVNGAIAFRNDIDGRVSGLEAWGALRATPAWRLSGGFTVQDSSFRLKPGRVDFGGLAALGNGPEHSATLRSAWSPTPNVDIDVSTRHVARLRNAVPAYTATDARIAWRATPSLELSLAVRNAFDREHVEWQNQGAIKRSFLFQLRWQPS